MRHRTGEESCKTRRVAIDRRQVHFRTNDLREILDEIQSLSDKASGREWVTISPWVDPENVPVVSLLRRMFSGRGPELPVVTWTPAAEGEPAQLGILHATGPNAYDRLGDNGVSAPSSWVKVSDHSKRGLVYAVHPDSTPAQVVDFAVDAAAQLSMVPTDDRWVAEVATSKR